jgi:adenylate cyclase
MKWWERLADRLGALPAKRVTWGLVLIFAIWVLLDVLIFQVTGGLAKSSYDAMVRARVFVAAPDPRIVIIDIDEASLARMGKEFGRWPWPRDTLATVLDHIERQQPAAIVWDILFSDADRLSPGGDAAFNEAARRSQHSHFSAVRLPKVNDAASQITRKELPGLWATQPSTPGLPTDLPAGRPPVKASTVALIPPVLPALANGRLGFNNGYVDADGVLRRFRHLEALPDGSALQSLPLSVLSTIDSIAYKDYLTMEKGNFNSIGELISWRKHVDAYPHVTFADVFAQAEGDKPREGVPTFAGKVVIIGATSPNLYDIHPTPLSPTQAGVDSLATVIDNALNRRHILELPRWLQAIFAIALCVGLALWVQFKGLVSLAPALFALPAGLLGISYLSLNGLPLFVDLHLAAGLALIFLAVLRFWNTLRRNHWCTLPNQAEQPLAIWAWERREAWIDDALDRLIDVIERHAPACRVVVCDASVVWPTTLRWPELARFAAIVGPRDVLLAARKQLEPAIRLLAHRSAEPLVLKSALDREKLAKSVFKAWSRLQNSDTNR